MLARMAKRPAKRDESTGGDPAVPAAIRPKYDPIWTLVERFCRERLNDEYRVTCQRLLATLARKRPSPLASGTPAGWASGVVRAIGYVNFLDDKTQVPHLKFPVIDESFGVSQATGQARSKAIRDLLKMVPFDPGWTLPSRMDDNPVAYLVTANGIMMDARHAPADVQRQAVERGLIPPLPAKYDKTGLSTPAPTTSGGPRLYTLEAFIVAGPIDEKFSEKNPEISRVIQIRGDQTLADLHAALFDAFDRFDEHMYEFQVGKGPQHPSNKRYVLPTARALGDDRPSAATVDGTTLDSLGLKVDQAFGYWFDFGDDWWHQVNVTAIDDVIPPGKYPKLTGRVGRSPPQYPDAE